MNREERDGVQDEEGESRGDARWRQLNREHQHDRSESDDGRERNGPRPQLASQDSDPRPERNDGGVPAQERGSGTQRIETDPHDPEQHRNDPSRGRYDGRSWTAVRGGRDHREARGDEEGERDDPDRPAEGPELNRTRQEEEPTAQEAKPDEPAYHLVRAGTHGSVICAERISVEPRWTGELSRKVSSAPRRCARVGAGRSAEDRLLCKQEVLGSNPSRSTPTWVQTPSGPLQTGLQQFHLAGCTAHSLKRSETSRCCSGSRAHVGASHMFIPPTTFSSNWRCKFERTRCKEGSSREKGLHRGGSRRRETRSVRQALRYHSKFGGNWSWSVRPCRDARTVCDAHKRARSK